MFEYLFFLSSGLFLGWSLGANDASNIFGTAVGTKMLRFTTAAIIASIFLVLGAVFSGQNTAETLNTLGEVNTLPAAKRLNSDCPRFMSPTAIVQLSFSANKSFGRM